MVLNLLKNIFVKSDKSQGELTIQNKSIGTVKSKIDEDILYFDDVPVIIGEIENLKATTNSILGSTAESNSITSSKSISPNDTILRKDTDTLITSFSFNYRLKKYIFYTNNYELYETLSAMVIDDNHCSFHAKVSYSVYNTENRTFEGDRDVEMVLIEKIAKSNGTEDNKNTNTIVSQQKDNHSYINSQLKTPSKDTSSPNNIALDLRILTNSAKYFLRVEDNHEIFHFQQISANIQYYLDQSTKAFIWSIFKDEGFRTFCIKFKENVEFLEFLTKYVKIASGGVYSSKDIQHKNQEPGFCAMEKGKHPDLDEDSLDDEDVWTESPITSSNNPLFESSNCSKDTSEYINKHLLVGVDQVFVTRGSSLGVFDQNLKFQTHIKNAFTDPTKLITHNGKQNLLIQNRKRNSELDLMDLERGEVIETWVLEDMNDYFDSHRGDNTDTLVGIGDYNLFRIDPRVKDKIVEKKEYKTKNNFNVGIATENGDVAIASDKLRLYNSIDKRAKSLFDGFGDKIEGIDTSKDGSIVLCTCKKYILVYKVNSNYGTANKIKLTPKRLQLKPQHLSMMNSDIHFTTAKFDQKDKFIISSTGKYIIKWKVSDVLANDVYNYSIKTLGDEIVDENFVFDGEDIVVALPNDVKHIQKNMLRRPRE